MIYYILLIIAVACIGIYFSIMNIYQKRVSAGLELSLVFALAYSLSALLIISVILKFDFTAGLYSILLGCMMAAFMIGNIVLGIKIMSVGKISLFTVFMMLGGMALPFMYGTVFLNENKNVFKFIALIVLTVALFLTLYDPGEMKSTDRKKLILYCVMVFITNGGTSILAKVHQISPYAVSEIKYAWLEYVFTALISSILLIICAIRNKVKVANAFLVIFSKHNFIFPMVYSVFLALSTILLLYAASELPASVQYPMVTGGTIVVTTLIGRFMFKEKLSRYMRVGIVLTVISTVLFAF